MKNLTVTRRVCFAGRTPSFVDLDDVSREEWEHFLWGYRTKCCQAEMEKARSQGFQVQFSDPEGCLTSRKPESSFFKK